MIKSNSDIFKLQNNFELYHDVESIVIFDNANSDYEVTIVIPTFKRASLLQDAIESAITQTEVIQYNILVVDNLSDRNDDTEILMQRYSSTLNISYYKNERNIGLFGNWNRCIELAKTPYIVFLHDDDLLLPNAMQNLFLIKNRINVPDIGIISQGYRIDKNGDVVGTQGRCIGFIKKLLFEPPLFYRIDKMQIFNLDFNNGCGALLNKDCLLRIGGFNPDYYPQSDYILLINYAALYPLYRLNENVKVDRMIENASLKVYKCYAIVAYLLRMKIIQKYFNSNSFLLFFAGIFYKSNRYYLSVLYGKSKLMKPHCAVFLTRVYNVISSIIIKVNNFKTKYTTCK